MFNYIKNKLNCTSFSPSLACGGGLVRGLTPKNNHCRGYSLLELVLASAVGAIVIAGAYTSYVIIAKQYERVSTFSEVQQAGIATIQMITRDLRMAGRETMDASINPVYGSIPTPISIVDSGNACCDSITIVYDKNSVAAQRCQIRYSIQSRTTGGITRNALFMTVTTLAGAACTGSGLVPSLVADYVDDMQIVGSDNDTSGNPRIVDISLIMRSQSVLPRTTTYTRPAQIVGNWNFNFNDNFHRDEFTATVNIKNLRD
jgi:prepilin-type N-terminal cleavage/methylation domain-containing protein